MFLWKHLGNHEVVTCLKDAQKATVTYVVDLVQLVRKLEVVDLLGKSGEVIDYSTIERIKYHSDRGYTFLLMACQNGVIFDGDSHVDQNFMVTPLWSWYRLSRSR